MEKVTIEILEKYLHDRYNGWATDQRMLLKLVEEIGEVAEVLNRRDGRKANNNDNLKEELANELVDVIHYAFAIASLNNIDLNETIIEKDKKASIKYNHKINLEQFIKSK